MEKDCKFRFYDTEDLLIDRIDKELDEEERKVRRFVMNYIIDNNEPFNLNKDATLLEEHLKSSKKEIQYLLEELDMNGPMVTDDEKNVNFIYPVSAMPTNHRVTLSDGRCFSAMCAIDALGAAFTFKQDTKINSSCSNCGEDIYVEIKNGEILEYYPKDMHILHVDLNKNSNWAGDC